MLVFYLIVSSQRKVSWTSQTAYHNGFWIRLQERDCQTTELYSQFNYFYRCSASASLMKRDYIILGITGLWGYNCKQKHPICLSHPSVSRVKHLFVLRSPNTGDEQALVKGMTYFKFGLGSRPKRNPQLYQARQSAGLLHGQWQSLIMGISIDSRRVLQFSQIIFLLSFSDCIGYFRKDCKYARLYDMS